MQNEVSQAFHFDSFGLRFRHSRRKYKANLLGTALADFPLGDNRGNLSAADNGYTADGRKVFSI
jgi:hypothetical protein